MRNMGQPVLEKEQYKAMVHYAGLTLIAIALLILYSVCHTYLLCTQEIEERREEIRKMSRLRNEANEVKSRFLV